MYSPLYLTYSNLSKYSSSSNFFSTCLGIHLRLNISLLKLGFLIADTPNPTIAPIAAPLPCPNPNSSNLKYLDKASPAKANDVDAFNGFSALFHPHATEPNTAPTPAPTSILVFLPILVVLTPKFHKAAVPIPSKAVGLVAAIKAPAPYFK